MSTLLDIFIPGTPRPQGSLQPLVSKDTGRAFVKYSNTTIQHRNMIILAIREKYQGEAFEGAVILAAYFAFARPKSHYGTGRNAELLKASAPQRHTQAPDSDKLLRLIGDSCEIAGVVKNDSQFIIARSEKSWAQSAEEVGTRIRVLAVNETGETQ